MNSYLLITYRGETGPQAGIVLGMEYYDAATVLKSQAYGGVQGILDNWDTCAPQLSAFAKGQQQAGRPLVSVELLSPIFRPGTIYCAGANYADHMANMAKKPG